MKVTEYITKDSGQREEFSTGSRRDSREGKGRYDLIPWEIVGTWSSVGDHKARSLKADGFDGAMRLITLSKIVKDETLLYGALTCISELIYGEEDWDDDGYGYDGLPWYAIERWAQLLERGAEKYGERNWEKGQPLSRYFDSAIRHLAKWRMGHEDEDHLAAALFNVAAILWTYEQIIRLKIPAELNDLYPAD